MYSDDQQGTIEQMKSSIASTIVTRVMNRLRWPMAKKEFEVKETATGLHPHRVMVEA